jgi:hypothetical protein
MMFGGRRRCNIGTPGLTSLRFASLDIVFKHFGKPLFELKSDALPITPTQLTD